MATLIASTRSRNRPISLTDVATLVARATKTLGSLQAVADRIGLSSKMLRQFTYVNRLDPKVRQLFALRRLDSVDSAVHLATLPPQEQIQVARDLADGIIDTIDVRAVAQLRRLEKTVSISQLLEKVKLSRTLREYIAEFVVRGKRDRQQLLATFGKTIPSNEILGLELNGAFGRLILTASGKRHLLAAAKRLGCTPKNVIPQLLIGLEE